MDNLNVGGLSAGLLLDTLPWGVLVFGADGVVHGLNQQAAAWWGQPPAAGQGQPLAARPPGHLPASLYQALQELAAGATLPPADFFLPHAQQWIRQTSTRQAGQVVVYWQASPARKQTEAETLAGPEEYRALFTALDKGFCTGEVLFDEQQQATDYRFLATNPTFEQQTGLAGAAGHTLRELAPAPETSGLEAYGRVARTGEPVRFEYEAAGLGRVYDAYAFRIGAPGQNRVAILLNDSLPPERAEWALHQSEAQFQAVANLVPDLLWRSDAQGDTTWCNQRWLDYTGQTLPRALGYGWADTTHPDDRDESARRYREAAQSGLPLRQEHRLRSAAGEYRWFQVQARPFRNEQGIITQWFGAAIDIHERRKAEEILRDSERRLQLAMRVGKQFEWEIDLSTELMTYSGDQQAVLGFELPAPVAGQFALIHPDDVEVARQTYAQAMVHQGPFVVEPRLLVPGSGQLIWVHLEGQFFNAPPRYVGIARNITARKQAEERQAFLLKLSDALRPLADPVAIQEAVTDAARRHFGADRCCYCEIEGSQIVIRCEAAAEGLPSVAGSYPLTSLALLQTVIEAGQPFGVRDVRQDEVVGEDLRELCVQLRVISYLNAPVIKKGQPAGVLCLVQSSPRDWAASDVALLTEVAERTWAAVERAKAEETLRTSEERHRAELEQQVQQRTAELQQSRDLLQATMDSSLDMIQVFEAVRGEAGQIVDFRWLLNNHTAESVYGEVRGQRLLERNPGVVEEGIFADFQRAVETGESQRVERHYVHEQFDGWFLQCVVKLGDGVATSTTDITAWQRAQAENLRLHEEIAAAKLQESEEKYRRLIDFVPAAVYACHADATLAYYNARAVALWGREPALEDKNWTLCGAWRTYLPDGTLLAPGESPMAGVLATGEPVVNHEVKIERPDHSIIDVLVNITALRDAAGHVVGAVNIFQDISARKRHEASLALLVEVSEDLAQLTNIDETMTALCQKIGAYFGAGACAFSPVDEAAGTIAVQYVWHRPDAISPTGIYHLAEYHSEEILRTMRAGRPEVVRDTAAGPAAVAAQLAALRIGAFVNLPLVREGAWQCTISLTASEPRDWRDDELDLLRELTVRIWTRLARARAESALHKSEAQFRLFVTTSAGTLYRMSPDWRQMLTLTSTNFLANTPDPSATWVEKYIPQPEQARAWAAIHAAIAAKGPFELEHRVYRPDGTVAWTFSRAVPVLDAQGEIVEWFGAATDITARKQAEQQLAEFNTHLEQQVTERTSELRNSRDLLHGIAEAQAASISAFKTIRDESGHIVDLEYVFVNTTAEQLDGGRKLVGRRYLEVFPAVANRGFLDSYRRVIETGVPEDRELTYPDEHLPGWFRSNATQLGDGVLVIGEDITARKQAEQERLKNLRLLEQAEAVAGLGSWDYDLATGQISWSDGMYRLFNLPLGQPVEPSIYFDYVVDEDQLLAERLVHQLTASTGSFEETVRLRVGEAVKTVRIKTVVLCDEYNHPVRVLGVDLDISEFQRLVADNLHLRLTQQRALFEAVQQVQEEERRRMAESLHNGIGQILYATKLRLDQLRPLMETVAPTWQPAHQAADQLLGEAIRQTRALSHELVPLVLKEFGLAAALQDIGSKMSSPQLRLRTQVTLDEDAGPLLASLQLALYRMAQELAQNIVKHAQGATEASLELETMPGWVLLRAEDNGSGFATLPAATAGLGLRSIRDQVALLGGAIQTGTYPDSGAYVRIRIPLFFS